MRHQLLGKQNGQSIIQVLVAVGIMVVAMMALISMQNQQSRESRALTETMAASDVGRVVTAALSNGSACSSLFATTNVVGGTMPFDASAVDGTHPVTLTFDKIYSGANTIIAASNALPSALSNTLTIAKTTAATPGITLSVSNMNPTYGTLQISFDQTKLIRPIKNLQFPISLQTSGGPLTSTTLTGCRSANANSNFLAFPPASGTFQVPLGVYQLTVEVWGGGGAGCGGWGGSGGGGGYSKCSLSVTPLQNFNVNIGNGGAVGAQYCNTNACDCVAQPGQTSTFQGAGYSCSASGGTQGSAGAGPGGNGTSSVGQGVLGVINLPGGDGSDLNSCPNGGWIARGGAAPRGGDGGGALGGGPGQLTAGTAPGGGGPASCWGSDIGNSGVGGQGAIHIYW